MKDEITSKKRKREESSNNTSKKKKKKKIIFNLDRENLDANASDTKNTKAKHTLHKSKKKHTQRDESKPPDRLSSSSKHRENANQRAQKRQRKETKHSHSAKHSSPETHAETLSSVELLGSEQAKKQRKLQKKLAKKQAKKLARKKAKEKKHSDDTQHTSAEIPVETSSSTELLESERAKKQRKLEKKQAKKLAKKQAEKLARKQAKAAKKKTNNKKKKKKKRHETSGSSESRDTNSCDDSTKPEGYLYWQDWSIEQETPFLTGYKDTILAYCRKGSMEEKLIQSSWDETTPLVEEQTIQKLEEAHIPVDFWPIYVSPNKIGRCRYRELYRAMIDLRLGRSFTRIVSRNIMEQDLDEMRKACEIAGDTSDLEALRFYVSQATHFLHRVLFILRYIAFWKVMNEGRPPNRLSLSSHPLLKPYLHEIILYLAIQTKEKRQSVEES